MVRLRPRPLAHAPATIAPTAQEFGVSFESPFARKGLWLTESTTRKHTDDRTRHILLGIMKVAVKFSIIGRDDRADDARVVSEEEGTDAGEDGGGVWTMRAER